MVRPSRERKLTSVPSVFSEGVGLEDAFLLPCCSQSLEKCICIVGKVTQLPLTLMWKFRGLDPLQTLLPGAPLRPDPPYHVPDIVQSICLYIFSDQPNLRK